MWRGGIPRNGLAGYRINERLEKAWTGLGGRGLLTGRLPGPGPGPGQCSECGCWCPFWRCKLVPTLAVHAVRIPVHASLLAPIPGRRAGAHTCLDVGEVHRAAEAHRSYLRPISPLSPWEPSRPPRPPWVTQLGLPGTGLVMFPYRSS